MNKKIYIAIITFLFSIVMSNNVVDKKQKTLNDIEKEIIALEGELKKQIQTKVGADQKLNTLKSQIAEEKEKFKLNKDQAYTTSILLENAYFTVDSLKSNLSKINVKKIETQKLIKDMKYRRVLVSNDIIATNENISIVKNSINQVLDSLDAIKISIQDILKETLFIDEPNQIEFIIESKSWDEFIFNSLIYDITIDNKKDVLNRLYSKKEKINTDYNKILSKQNNKIKKQNKLKNDLLQSEKLINRLNKSLELIDLELSNSQTIYNEINKQYISIINQLDNSESKLQDLKNQKNEITQIQKYASDERKRIEYALVLKKESRDKVERELKKLLLKSSKYTGTDLKKYKKSLVWPMNGKLLTKYGLNTSEVGTKFDYTFIELVSDEILYLVNEINPNSPNVNIVKKFQRLTMGLKSGDKGYGVFGPQTTRKWKKFNNELKKNVEKESIIAIYDGIVEEIKFIDPITGALIIIKHNNQSFSTYSGQIDMIVEKGDIVIKGQKIGLIKKDKILAFSLLVDGNLVNPEEWLINK